MSTNLINQIKALQKEPWAKKGPKDKKFWIFLTEWIERNVLSEFLERVSKQVDDIVDIDPDLSEPQILEKAAQYMVEFLGAHSASARIWDPQSAQMLSYGAYDPDGYIREAVVPLEGSIAGEVVKTRQPCLVPDILHDDRYKNKEIIKRRGVHSLMAIPFEIARFSPVVRDTVGVIQIYFRERERIFASLEVQMANVMAKRLSLVIARKKILSIQRATEKKEVIIQRIYRSSLERRGGIRLNDIFNNVIPDLADMVNVQSCAFFSVAKDLSTVVLESGYPSEPGYHGIGKIFSVNEEPALEVVLKLRDYTGDSVYEYLTPSYLLVVDPQKSELISNELKDFARLHSINSILYIPLEVYGEISHIITFDALDQRQRYSDDEIDAFLFLGRELLRAQRMERLNDALHDFKNPAIAIAGFARRLKKMIENGIPEGSDQQVLRYADILVEETSRIQELALSIYTVGGEKVINLTDVLQGRFEINREAIKEQFKQNVMLVEGGFDPHLTVRCHVIHLERLFDNLLHNATKAIPLRGGELSIRTYREGEWACAEIINTGDISEEDRLRILEGEGEGRGSYITNRIISLLRGKLEVFRGEGTTSVLVRLPIYENTDDD